MSARTLEGRHLLTPISPGTAAQWMQLSVLAFDGTEFERVVEKITSGRLVLTEEADRIKVTADSRIVAGIHVLAAIWSTGTHGVLCVLELIDEPDAEATTEGRLKHRLEQRGIRNAAVIAALARRVHLWYQGIDPTDRAARRTVTEDQILQAIEGCPRADPCRLRPAALAGIRTGHRLGMDGSALAFAYWLITHYPANRRNGYSDADADRYLDALLDGPDAVRSALTRDQGRSESEQITMLIHGFNAYHRNEPGAMRPSAELHPLESRHAGLPLPSARR